MRRLVARIGVGGGTKAQCQASQFYKNLGYIVLYSDSIRDVRARAGNWNMNVNREYLRLIVTALSHGRHVYLDSDFSLPSHRLILMLLAFWYDYSLSYCLLRQKHDSLVIDECGLRNWGGHVVERETTLDLPYYYQHHPRIEFSKHDAGEARGVAVFVSELHRMVNGKNYRFRITRDDLLVPRNIFWLRHLDGEKSFALRSSELET